VYTVQRKEGPKKLKYFEYFLLVLKFKGVFLAQIAFITAKGILSKLRLTNSLIFSKAVQNSVNLSPYINNNNNVSKSKV